MIALHSAPRFAVGFMYMRMYQRKMPVEEYKQGLYKLLYKLVFVIYNLETACLILVSYISNKENYRQSIISFKSSEKKSIF